MNQNKLAIIIPAYKARFLRESLKSIERQSCHNFNVYIGDDCSPENLKPIVDEFVNSLPITYVRFEDNEGGNNLVNHWNRCLSLAQNEDYYWLFSDDDIMSDNCVEEFYKTLSQGFNEDVFHFNIDIINSNGDIINTPPCYPKVISSESFFSLLFMSRINARVPEFIFRSCLLMSNGGFVNFDLAWRSDNATVIENALKSGIRTIEGAKVLWRLSDINISSENKLLAERKDDSTINFFNWVHELYTHNNIHCSLTTIQLVIAYRKKMGISCATFNPISLYKVAMRFKVLNSFEKRLLFVFISYYVRIVNFFNRIYEN